MMSCFSYNYALFVFLNLSKYLVSGDKPFYFSFLMELHSMLAQLQRVFDSTISLSLEKGAPKYQLPLSALLRS